MPKLMRAIVVLSYIVIGTAMLFMGHWFEGLVLIALGNLLVDEAPKR